MNAHYDDDALIALLDTPDDPHIAECADCRASFEEYQAVTSSLGDNSVWNFRPLNEEPNRQTIANLQSFASAMRAEDEAATPLVAELLAGPREEWMPRLLANEKYRTAGVVRALMEASDKAIDVMPPDALEISALATEIADKLDPKMYPSDTVMKLRGNAWRDRGYCLYRCSHFAESTRALNVSNQILSEVVVADYDIARLGIARAVLERSFESFRSASRIAERSVSTFRSHGDTNRMVSAALASAQAKWKSGSSHEALNDLLALSALDAVDADTQSRLFITVAAIHRDLGDEEAAITYFTQARFANGDSNCNELLIQWSIAILLSRVGAGDQAEKALLQLSKSFEALGLYSEAVQVGLNLAELYLQSGRHSSVEVVCRRAIDFYTRGGLSMTERVLTAFGYLHESARQRRTTPATVREVRRFLSGEAIVLALPPSS